MQMLGTVVPPHATPWVTCEPPERFRFWYLSRVATCAGVLNRRILFVSSADNGECDTLPAHGMCIFNDHNIIRYVEGPSRQYLKGLPMTH